MVYRPSDRFVLKYLLMSTTDVVIHLSSHLPPRTLDQTKSVNHRVPFVVIFILKREGDEEEEEVKKEKKWHVHKSIL